MYADAANYQPSRYDYILRELQDQYGTIETWHDISGKSIKVRLADGSVHTLYESHMMSARQSEEYFVAWLLEILNKRELDQTETVLLEPDTTPSYKRLKEINDELDIIRGRVPTPKGYKVDLGRTKALMAELKKLLEETR